MTGLLFLLLLLPVDALAQSSTAAGWAGVEGTLEVGDRVEFSLEEEFRGEVAPQGPAELLTSLSGRYSLSRAIAFQAGYRLDVPLPAAPVGHRLALDLRLTHRMDAVRIKFRQRYTVQSTGQDTHTLRSRLGAEYRFDTFRPFVSVEPFFRVAPERRLHKVRFTLGTQIHTSGAGFQLFTHFEQQTDGDRLFVGGISTSFGTKVPVVD